MFITVFHNNVLEADLSVFSAVLFRDKKKNINFLRCRTVDRSEGHYLKVTAEYANKIDVVDLYIPHQLILAIVGADGRANPVGFAGEIKSPKPSAA